MGTAYALCKTRFHCPRCIVQFGDALGIVCDCRILYYTAADPRGPGIICTYYCPRWWLLARWSRGYGVCGRCRFIVCTFFVLACGFAAGARFSNVAANVPLEG